MTQFPFYIVDVFGVRKYSGNQLAVVGNAGSLTTEQMQEITREMGFSETSFILTDEERDGGYDVRIFTPRGEVPFAGHPTLGTAFVIQREILGGPVSELAINLKIGKILVDIEYEGGSPGVLWMSQPRPDFGPAHDAGKLAPVLNIAQEEVDGRYPVEEVSTGFPYVIVPVCSLEALEGVSVDLPRYYAYIENTNAKAILVFCPDARSNDNDLSMRVFGDYYGVPEDPATGSAAGCLGAYLSKHRSLGGDVVDVRVEQGYELRRPSLLLVKADFRGGEIGVRVGGSVFMVAQGELV